jgi:predicted amino acid racemase
MKGTTVYPRLIYHLGKLKHNLDTVSRIVRDAGLSLMIVTKAFCAEKPLLEMIAAHPDVDFIADSRLKNLAKMVPLHKARVLLRIAQPWEVPKIIRHADISFQSEWESIRLLESAAKRAGCQHKVVLMVDLGDLREGIYFENRAEILELSAMIRQLDFLELFGIATNLTCYGGVIPTTQNLSLLSEIAAEIKSATGARHLMVSGGNSSSIPLAAKGILPPGINNLRLGESFLLGRETAYGTPIENTFQDTAILQAQVIEVKEKPSLPVGEIGRDAFGQIPVFEDHGIRKRAILALGRQDVDIDSLFPKDAGIRIIGASSDHLIVDATDAETDCRVGNVVEFVLGYSGLLRAATSPYVFKAFQP